MIIQTIPQEVISRRKALVRCARRNNEHLEDTIIPDKGIAAVSTGKGFWKPGVLCWLIGSLNRVVYLGEKCIRTEIVEYMALTEHGELRLIQLGRDANMIQDNQPRTGAACACKRGIQRDNCPQCEGTGMVIDFAAIRRTSNV